MGSRMIDRLVGGACALAAVALGFGLAVGLGGTSGVPPWERRPDRVFALTSEADGSFAVCTVPLDGGTEGFFMLDFETGDLSGGVLSPGTSKFAASYKYNVLKDLGFKAGQVKNPKFLLVSGAADVRQASAALASSVLYVTDSSTGTTVAYGIPWSGQQPQVMAPLMPLDIARPRGGGPKAK
jgi:hypothetical protein